MIAQQPKFYAREDTHANGYRVFRDGWANDAFEVLTLEEFAALEIMFKRFGIPVTILTDDQEPVDFE